MNYKIIFSIIGLVAIIGIVFALNPIQESSDEESENLEKQAIEIVKSYQGIDGKGESLLDTIRTIIDEVYSEQNVVLIPGTNISWSAIKDSLFSNTYQVRLEIKTSQENSLFIWKVDLDSKKVWSNQDAAQIMLDLIDHT